MTAVTTALGLFPCCSPAVVGGLFIATLLTLLVLPALYKWFADKPENIGEVH